MKKAVIVLIFILVLVLTACEKSTDNPEEEKITFGYVGLFEDGFQLTLKNSMAAEAAIRGHTFIYYNGANDQPTQIAAIRSLIAQNVDVIGFFSDLTTDWTEVLGEAKAAGIPVLFFDRIADPDESLWAARITFDYDLQGQKAGIWVRDSSSIDSGSLKIVELTGPAGSDPAVKRAAGFRKTITTEASFMASLDGSFTEGTAYTVLSEWLDSDPNATEVNVIFAQNDAMALGAITAIQEHDWGGNTRSPGTDIEIVSVDAIGEALQEIVNGTLNCSVQTTPYLGPLFLDAAEALARGETVARVIASPNCPSYTAANVTQELVDSWPY